MAKNIKIRHIGDNPLDFLATNHIQNGHFVSIGYLSDTKLALSKRYITPENDAELANRIANNPDSRFGQDFAKARLGAKYQKGLSGQSKTGEFEISPVHILKMTRYNFQWKNAEKLRQDYEERELPLEQAIRKHHGFTEFDSANEFDETDWHVKKNSKGGWKYGGPSIFPEVADGNKSGLGWKPIGGGEADFFEHEKTHNISFRQVMSDKNIKSYELYYVSEDDGVLNPFDQDTYNFLKDGFGRAKVENAIEDVLDEEKAFLKDMEILGRKFNHFNFKWERILYFCGSTAGVNSDGGIEYEPFIWINDAVVAKEFPFLDKNEIDDMIERSVRISQEDLENWKATPKVWESKALKQNKKALYESIMKSVSKQVKKALNEEQLFEEVSDGEAYNELYNIVKNDFDGITPISDFEIIYNGTQIDYVYVQGSELQFWAGDPIDDDDKFAEELIINEDDLENICQEIVDLL